jgi:magnesium transporter
MPRAEPTRQAGAPAYMNEDILDHPVTRYMRFDFCRVKGRQTVAEALADLRIQQPQGRIIYFYVMDEADRLEGVVPTRRLLLSQTDAKVADLMVRNVITVPSTATVREACELFLEHRFLAFPVVNEGRMVGIVDVELFAEGIDDLEQTKRQEDLFQLMGVHLSAAQHASPWAGFTSRFPWLLCNVAGGILAAILTYAFETLLAKVVSLALFIPVVLGLSESVAIQSVTLALLVMHGQRPTMAALWNRLRRELLTGFLLGAACGLIIALVALVWLRLANVALALLTGIGLGIAGSAVFGLAMPYLLRLLHRDPKVAAGPVSLVFADMLTLTIYFSVAQWLLG